MRLVCITVMSETGLDPSVYHLYAIWTIDAVHKSGGKIGRLLVMLWRKGNGNEERERDFVFLRHKLDIERADGKHETRINTLCDYGDPIE